MILQRKIKHWISSIQNNVDEWSKVKPIMSSDFASFIFAYLNKHHWTHTHTLYAHSCCICSVILCLHLMLNMDMLDAGITFLRTLHGMNLNIHFQHIWHLCEIIFLWYTNTLTIMAARDISESSKAFQIIIWGLSHNYILHRNYFLMIEILPCLTMKSH